MPMFPFLVLSVVTWFIGKNIKSRPAAGADAKQKADGKSGKSSEAAANAAPGAAAAPAADKLENLLGVVVIDFNLPINQYRFRCSRYDITNITDFHNHDVFFGGCRCRWWHLEF